MVRTKWSERAAPAARCSQSAASCPSATGTTRIVATTIPAPRLARTSPASLLRLRRLLTSIRLAGRDRTHVGAYPLNGGSRRVFLMHQQVLVIDLRSRIG